MLPSFVPGKDKRENKRNEKNISSVFFGVDVLASVPTHKSKFPFGDIHTPWGDNPLRNLWFATAYLNTHEHLGFQRVMLSFLSSILHAWVDVSMASSRVAR